MNKYFEINSQTSLKYDTDCNKFYTNNNNKIYEHSMYPMVLNDSTTNRTKYIQSSDVNGILQSNNYDGKGAVIDDSSRIRFGEMTDQDGKKELPTRIFQGVPYMGAGQSVLKNTDLSSRLIYAEDTRVKKSSNGLSGVSIDNFIPLVPSIADNIQDPKHIIPEYWIRGGMSTRTVVRNVDYMKSCGLRK
jgi:hypothetical protein